jgi:hypothetical protein
LALYYYLISLISRIPELSLSITLKTFLTTATRAAFISPLIDLKNSS